MNNPAYSHEKQGTDWDKPLSIGELAVAIGRSERYVYYMKRLGFAMIGGRATVRMAMEFLEKHPEPTKQCAKCSSVQDSAEEKK